MDRAEVGAEAASPQDPFAPTFFLRNGGLPDGMETKDELPETHGLSGEGYMAAEALLRYIGSCAEGGAPHPGRMYLTPLLVTMFVRHYSDAKERCEKLAASLAWRMLPHLEFSTLLMRRIAMARKADSLWPSCVYGSDHYGRVVQAHRLKLIVIDELLAYEDMRPLVVVRAQLMEAMMRMKLECSARAGFRVYKNILVVDLDGFAFGTALKLRSEVAREKLQALFALGDHYPGSVDKIFLTNTPGIFRGAWKLIKKTLDPVTAGKIHMHATHAACRADMLACQIPMESIPEWMGGRHGGTSLLALVESRIAQSEAAAAAEEGGASAAVEGGPAETLTTAAPIDGAQYNGSAAEAALSPPRASSTTSLAVAEDYLVGEMTPCVDVEVAVLGRPRSSVARRRSSSVVEIEKGAALRLFLECTVSSRTFNAEHFGSEARIDAWRSMLPSAARDIAAREQRVGAHGALEGFSKRTTVYHTSSSAEVELLERSHVELDGAGLRPVRCVLESKRQVKGDEFFVLSRLVLTERRRRAESELLLGADTDYPDESEPRGAPRGDAEGDDAVDASAPPDLPLIRVQVGVHVVFNRSLAGTLRSEMPRSEVTAQAVYAARVEWTQWLSAAKRACSIPATERDGAAATPGVTLKERASASASAETTAPTSPGVADVVKVDGLDGDLERFNGMYKIFAGMTNDDAPVWRTIEVVADPEAPDEPDHFYIYRDVDEHWWAMGDKNDVEGNSGDVTSEEIGAASPVGLMFGGDYGSPTVQVATAEAAAAAPMPSALLPRIPPDAIIGVDKAPRAVLTAHGLGLFCVVLLDGRGRAGLSTRVSCAAGDGALALDLRAPAAAAVCSALGATHCVREDGGVRLARGAEALPAALDALAAFVA